MGIAVFHLLLDVVEGIEHQQAFAQAGHGRIGKIIVVQRGNHWLYVIATEHCAQNFNGAVFINQRRGSLTGRYSSKKSCLYVRRLVYTSGNTLREQVHQELLFASRRLLQQIDERCSLRCT